MDFIDEKEIFDSDFQSTDEEEMQENVAGDSEIVDEEKRDKQVRHSKKHNTRISSNFFHIGSATTRTTSN